MKKAFLSTQDNLGFVEKGEIGQILERYELKYTIPYHLIDEISRFISPYCFLDNYSETSPDQFYTINSLYFDTPSFLFIRSRIAREHKRFHLRIRSYGDQPQLPYFLEVKQRKGDVIKKLRAKIFDADLEKLLNSPVVDEFLIGDKEAVNRAAFMGLLHTYNAQPQVIVQYRRKAYISHCDDYARVTFDKELRYMEQHEYSPIPIEKKMAPCDRTTDFDTGCSLVLELKCYTSFVPLWMIDCIRKFQLRRRAFSKYVACMTPIFLRYQQMGCNAHSTVVDDDD